MRGAGGCCPDPVFPLIFHENPPFCAFFIRITFNPSSLNRLLGIILIILRIYVVLNLTIKAWEINGSALFIPNLKIPGPGGCASDNISVT